MRNSLVTFAFVLGALGSAAADDKPWPPTGPTWETDPAKAFEKAREEKKPVFVYIATEACPHCVVMAREVWPKPEVVTATKDVVCLAVYRWAREGTAKADGTKNSEWAQRLDVMGYPQVRLLDAWGRTLPSSDRFASLRTMEAVMDAVGAARKEERESRSAPKPPSPPKSLLARLSPGEREEASRAEPWLRAGLWVKELSKGSWKPADLALLWGVEEDAIVRTKILDGLESGADGEEVVRLLSEGMGGSNDYVRSAAIEASVRVGGDVGVKSLLGTLETALGGRSGWKNVNNVLCAATDAVQRMPDPRFVEALAKVIEAHDANNTATLNAVESLVEIGKKHGMARVKPALLAARERPGAHQKRIRQAVDDAVK